MRCPSCCKYNVVQHVYTSFKYYYCKDCKNEVKPSINMWESNKNTISDGKDELVEELNAKLYEGTKDYFIQAGIIAPQPSEEHNITLPSGNEIVSNTIDEKKEEAQGELPLIFDFEKL